MTPPDRAPGPRRGRPRRISQDRIVEAAIELGLDAFSMQGIAEHLGVTTPALYSHVAGREEVVELVNAALVRRMQAFASTATDWRGWLADFGAEVRRHLAASATTLIVDMHGPDATVGLGVGEHGLRLLLDAGFTPAEAGRAVWLVFRVAITAGPPRATTLARFVDDTGAVLGPAGAAAFPATQQVHDALAAEGPGDTFDFDLDVVLDGIARRLDARRHAHQETTT